VSLQFSLEYAQIDTETRVNVCWLCSKSKNNKLIMTNSIEDWIVLNDDYNSIYAFCFEFLGSFKHELHFVYLRGDQSAKNIYTCLQFTLTLLTLTLKLMHNHIRQLYFFLTKNIHISIYFIRISSVCNNCNIRPNEALAERVKIVLHYCLYFRVPVPTSIGNGSMEFNSHSPAKYSNKS
jgi:hypothetical protein